MPPLDPGPVLALSGRWLEVFAAIGLAATGMFLAYLAWELLRAAALRSPSRRFFDQAVEDEPVVTHRDAVVAFFDIRGFTPYVKQTEQYLVSRFLEDYFAIYPQAVQQALKVKAGGLKGRARRVLLEPDAFKRLGDGMMLVWEFPGDRYSREQRDAAVVAVLDITQKIRELFAELVTRDSFGEGAKRLRLGCGITRGTASRVDYRKSGTDYVGPVVNMAARLQDKARGEGIVASYDMCAEHFQQLVHAGAGTARRLELRDIGAVKIFASNGVDLPAEVEAVDPAPATRPAPAPTPAPVRPVVMTRSVPPPCRSANGRRARVSATRAAPGPAGCAATSCGAGAAACPPRGPRRR
jgi:class 3 adenylate cyclase